MISLKLQNRVAIVTGGSSGIGRGIAIELAREGAKVAVGDVQEAPRRGKYYERDVTATTVAEIERFGSEGFFVETDVSDEGAVKRLVERTVERFGGLDILVNNAGILAPGTSESLPLGLWERAVDVNLKGAFLATKYAMPHLRKSASGRVINISSVQAFGGGTGPAYSASKAGILNMTRDTALEAAPHHITANSICPGFIETAIQDVNDEKTIQFCRAGTPLPRFGTPRDVGLAAVFLASDDASWITGAALPVDGGFLASLY